MLKLPSCTLMWKFEFGAFFSAFFSFSETKTKRRNFFVVLTKRKRKKKIILCCELIPWIERPEKGQKREQNQEVVGSIKQERNFVEQLEKKSFDHLLAFQHWKNMFKNTFQSGFLSILYSIGSKPLQIWDKKVEKLPDSMSINRVKKWD